MFKWNRVDLNAPTDRADFVRQWLLKLIDPDTKQAQTKLQVENGAACCLGVACCVAGIEKKLSNKNYVFGKERDDSHLPKVMTKFLKMDSGGDLDSNCYDDNKFGYSSLIDANDSDETFRTIAKFIRNHPKAVFNDLTKLEADYIINTELPTREAFREIKRAQKNAAIASNTGEASPT